MRELIVVKDPPFCIYCLLKNAMKDDFFKAELERLVKVAPLITQVSR